MKFITIILALAVLALPSCRHGRTGPQGAPGEPGLDGNQQDGIDGIPIIVWRGIDGMFLGSYVSVLDALPDSLGGLEVFADDLGLIIVYDGAIYAVRTWNDDLVVLRSAEEGDLPGGEIQNSRGRLAVGDTVIFGGLGPK